MITIFWLAGKKGEKEEPSQAEPMEGEPNVAESWFQFQELFGSLLYLMWDYWGGFGSFLRPFAVYKKGHGQLSFVLRLLLNGVSNAIMLYYPNLQ